MRSCENSTVKQRGKTKLLTIANIVFGRRDSTRSKIDARHPNFYQEAFYVSITFISQKHDIPHETRTQSRTDDPILCPVKIWGRILRRIFHSCPNAPEDTPVNCWFPKPTANNPTPRPRFIRAEDSLKLLRESCIHPTTKQPFFGYHPRDIGTHSIRSGAAMALFLTPGISVLRIMILGRWQSAAFMRYIRPQVMAMLSTADFKHADPTGVNDENSATQTLTWTEIETIQSNLESAIDSPEEIKFNGSVTTDSFDRQLNLEF